MREDRLDDATLDELARLHEAATDAPWAWEMTGDKDNSWGVGLVIDDNDEPVAGRNEPGEGLLVEPICDGSNHPPDAELIATVRNALPSLLAEVRAARATETAARALLDAIDGPDGSVLIDDLGISTIQAAREALRAALSAASTEPRYPEPGAVIICGADLGEYGRCELAVDHDGMHAGAPPAGGSAASAPTDEPERAMLNVLCECGHRAGRHGAGEILGSKCYEHVDVEQWCPCERFISTGVMAVAPGPEGSDRDGRATR